MWAMTDIDVSVAPRADDASGASLSRRRALSLLGLGGAALLAACSSSSSATTGTTATTGGAASTTSASSTGASSAAAPTAAGTTAATTATTTGSVATTAATAADLTLTPAETGGPFPADGTNANGAGRKADMLADPRTVRSDIRADLDGSNVQDGVPMTLAVTVLDDATGKAVPGAAVYIWHCSKTGIYSQYNSNMLGGDYSARTYLRGVQIADGNGLVTFQTILPGRYQGRAFHIHFEVFGDGSYAEKLLTSQIAVDDDQIDTLYAAAGYAAALKNDTNNDRDNVFSDGVRHQLMTLAGSATSGLAATFTAVV